MVLANDVTERLQAERSCATARNYIGFTELSSDWYWEQDEIAGLPACRGRTRGNMKLN